MTFFAIIALFGLLGLLLIFSCARNLRRHRILGGFMHGALACILFLLAGGALFIAANMKSFQHMSGEEAVGQIQFTRVGYHQFNGVFTFPSGDRTDFALRGDEWQVDARMLKWNTFANWIGFDGIYRLDRISGRYTRIEDERSLTRTVYSLTAPERIDLWQFVQDYQSWIPWVDALYGTATFLPMADGAVYEVSASTAGLIARPLNPAARSAVGNWH